VDEQQLYLGNCKRIFTLVSPEGTHYEVHNLRDFCRTHNLQHGNMTVVLNKTGKLMKSGKMTYPKQHKGWTGWVND